MPDEIRILVAFLNTEDVRKGTDVLDKPHELQDGSDVKACCSRRDAHLKDLDKILDVRDGLRALAFTPVGGAIDKHAMRQLDEAARQARVRLRFHEDGSASFAAEAFDEALGQLVELIVRTRREGLWTRLKICADEACRVLRRRGQPDHEVVYASVR